MDTNEKTLRTREARSRHSDTQETHQFRKISVSEMTRVDSIV